MPTSRQQPAASIAVEAALAPGVEDGHIPGAQVYVSVAGETLVDVALGEARLGQPMTTSTIVPWMCATKPVTAAAICLLAERNRLRLDDSVVRYVPQFGENGKAEVTIRHLLTHTVGFVKDPPWRSYGGPSAVDVEKLVCASERHGESPPGAAFRYSDWYGYSALGTVAERVDGRPFSRFVREELFEPLGLVDSWLGVDSAALPAVTARLAHVYDTGGPRPEVLPFGGIFQGRNLHACSPASGGIGPMRELARLYESFLASLAGESRALLGRETVSEMVRPAVLSTGRRSPYGLGFLAVGRFFGAWCPRAFGHPGLRCLSVYADPDTGVVVAAMVNGLGPGTVVGDCLHAVGVAVHEALSGAAS
ncbi:MAG: beta-lactamase family protein [Acidimicrobiia bacterium]|nr:beta-lactamase family protein [Acidimicrobiia bacterium]